MPQYSWNTAKVGVKHQSMNQLITYIYSGKNILFGFHANLAHNYYTNENLFWKMHV